MRFGVFWLFFSSRTTARRIRPFRPSEEKGGSARPEQAPQAAQDHLHHLARAGRVEGRGQGHLEEDADGQGAPVEPPESLRRVD